MSKTIDSFPVLERDILRLSLGLGELGYLWISVEQITKNYKWENNEWIEI